MGQLEALFFFKTCSLITQVQRLFFEKHIRLSAAATIQRQDDWIEPPFSPVAAGPWLSFSSATPPLQFVCKDYSVMSEARGQ